MCNCDCIAKLKAMIEETESAPRETPRPILGGPKAAPFDGEAMGRFLRVEILKQAVERIS